MSIKLTLKQKKVLELIYNSLKLSGFPPTLADLKTELGVSSNQSIINFLNALEERGYVSRKDKQARSIKILPLGFKTLEKEQLVPVLGTSSAGSYVESFDNMFRWFSLPGEVLKNEKVNQARDEVFVIQVHGDSMINAQIDDGDMLLIKKTREYRNGDIVVARSDDGTTVKRFVAEPDGRSYLKPENPSYKNMPIFEETVFEGKVILNLSKINNK